MLPAAALGVLFGGALHTMTLAASAPPPPPLPLAPCEAPQVAAPVSEVVTTTRTPPRRPAPAPAEVVETSGPRWHGLPAHWYEEMSPERPRPPETVRIEVVYGRPPEAPRRPRVTRTRRSTPFRPQDWVPPEQRNPDGTRRTPVRAAWAPLPAPRPAPPARFPSSTMGTSLARRPTHGYGASYRTGQDYGGAGVTYRSGGYDGFGGGGCRGPRHRGLGGVVFRIGG